MMLLSDGSSEHGAHIWYFDLLKAFGYNKKLVKSALYFNSYVRNMFWAAIVYKYHASNPGKYLLVHVTIHRQP